VAGTAATAVLLELRFTLIPPTGAFADSVRVRCCVAVPITVMVVGEKVTVAFTCTGALAVT
jgi:hypothetical protein